MTAKNLFEDLKHKAGFVADMLFALQTLDERHSLTSEDQLRLTAASMYASCLSSAFDVLPETLQTLLNEKVYHKTFQNVYEFAEKEKIPLYMVPMLIDLCQYTGYEYELRLIYFARSLETIRLNTVRFRATGFNSDVESDIVALEVILHNEFPNVPVSLIRTLAILSVTPYPDVYQKLCEQIKSLIEEH